MVLSPSHVGTGSTPANTHIANTGDTDLTASSEQIFGFVGLIDSRVDRDILDKLSALQRLPRNWDSYEAEPPAERAVATARNLLIAVYTLFSVFPRHSVRPEHVAPLADGGIQIEWYTPKKEIAVQVGPLGALGYLYVDRERDEEVVREEDDASQGVVLGAIAEVVLAS